MERVGVRELLARVIHREPGGNQLPMLQQPVRVLVASGKRILAQQDPPVLRHRPQVPLEEPTADDLGGLRLGGHHHRLAEPVQHLLEAVVIRLVFRGHLQLRGRDGDHQHDAGLAARRLRQVVQEVIELRGQPALAAAAAVVHQLVHQGNISARVTPAATMSSTSPTRMRIPRIQGEPPQTCESDMLRSSTLSWLTMLPSSLANSGERTID
jgi:hypothetical protein